jgi:hypothetical protein
VLERDERVSANRNSPLHRTPNVGAKQIAVDANYGVWQSGYGESTECGPHHRRRRNVPAREIGVRRSERISDQHCRASAESAPEEKVQPRAVRRCGSNGPITTRSDFSFLVVPLENNLAMACR